MPLSEYIGDIFEADTQTVVNTVNTVGAMGKGIALGFKEKYPEMYERYRHLCNEELFKVGQLWIYKTPIGEPNVLNFPTKKHWRNDSKPEWIEAGLINFNRTYKERGISSITFPALGCSNGGLNYEKHVMPIMFKWLEGLDIDVKIVLEEKHVEKIGSSFPEL